MTRAGIDRVYERRLADLVNYGRPMRCRAASRALKKSRSGSRRGRISTRPHPRGLGSPLTDEHITTDYSRRCSSS